MTREEALEKYAEGRDLQGADLRSANLRCADFERADLRGANLMGANLRCADFERADLWGADLRGADLRGADLRGADLMGANLMGAYLRGANINWTRHELVAEILRQAAGDNIEKLQLAGLILVCKNKCWEEFMQIEQVMKLKDWWLEVFKPFFEEHPENIPHQVKKLLEEPQCE